MKLAVVVTENYSAWNFRRHMLRAAVESGLDTYLVAPSGEYDDGFRSLGVKLVPVDVDRVINPWRDASYCLDLVRKFRQHGFDIVHNVSIKPNIYGALAGRLAGVSNIVGSVTGLGNVYMDEMGPRFRAIRPLVTPLYRLAFSLTDRVWFQNPDDAEFFIASGMLSRDKAVVIRGSGVDLKDFSPAAVDAGRVERLRGELNLEGDEVVVSMFSRALSSKGVSDFINAARILGEVVPRLRFVFVGDVEPGNPLSLSREAMSMAGLGNYSWLGWRHDVRDLLAVSDIVALPSRYREGIPKSLLEAMAMGKPLVTTDVAGCREAVEEGENGFIVPPGDVVSLAEAIGRLALNGSMRERFGRRSRDIAEKEFGIDRINTAIIEELYLWKNAS